MNEDAYRFSTGDAKRARKPAHAGKSGVSHEVLNGYRDKPLTERYPQEAPPPSLHSAQLEKNRMSLSTFTQTVAIVPLSMTLPHSPLV